MALKRKEVKEITRDVYELLRIYRRWMVRGNALDTANHVHAEIQRNLNKAVSHKDVIAKEFSGNYAAALIAFSVAMKTIGEFTSKIRRKAA